MQSLDNWVSAGDICEAWPCDPGKNALKVGGKLPLPLHHGLQDSPGAAQQTQPLQKNNNRPTVDGKKKQKKHKNTRTRVKKKCGKSVERNRNRDRGKKGKAENMYRIRRRTWSELCLTDLAVSFWLPPHPPWDHFHPLWVKRKPGWKWKVTQARAQALAVERGEDPCCKGPAAIQKHLPLCGRLSRPIVVQKLVVLPLAPFGSRGMRQTPLLFRVQIRGWIDAWPRLPSPLAVALCPLSQSTVSFWFLLFTSQEHFQANIPIVFSLLLLYSYSPFSFGVYAYCSLEHPHYTHSYILRASLFDFGLMGSEWWAGGSCRAGPALRAPQPASRRVGLGVLSGLGTTGATASAGGCMWAENWKVNNEGRTKKKKKKGKERVKQKEMESFKKLRAMEHR